MSSDERQLWQSGDIACVMISCCAGAELQLRKAPSDVILRELYPTKSDLYERARSLAMQYAADPDRRSLKPDV